MSLSLDQLNAAQRDAFVALLEGIYEHSPWIAEAAWAQRPFSTVAQLKYALARVVRHAGPERQKGLIRAHPELAGKAAVAGQLTIESTHEQSRAGLTHCTATEFARLQQLNADYNARFCWPFILAVRGPRGTGLTRQQIIETFARRLDNPADFELAECLRNIHRIAEIRLHDKFDTQPDQGNLVWDWAEALAQHSEPGYAERDQLTVTYMTAAHQACAAQLKSWMQTCGFDDVSVDAVGNVVGVYHGTDAHAPRLLTGSHYDTVRNGGKYDGRLGILVPMACVRTLHQQGRRLKRGIEVVGFAEEEGQRFKATFMGSSALVGDFQADWLDQVDADGISLRAAMQAAGHSALLPDIQALKRDPARYLGFVEVHIEQGPWLDEIDQPLGVVTAINGSVRYAGEVIGQASHAGTTPMDRRKDAAAAVAELVLYVEQRASWDTHSPKGPSVGTVGILQVPAGSVNVVPGRCQFTLDLRAPDDAQRDAMAADVLKQLAAICERRGLRHELTLSMQACAAPSDPALQARWEAAVLATGLPVFKLPSGAGHDAMKLHQCMPQAMLFVRGGNAGISHNPLETITNDDAQHCVDAFMHLLEQL
ncbi:MAG: 2-oxo-4-hydroxy-4-carboxy-5-ureidoimidazoline decarboxylase [Aquabacterium sp.]|uniref:2-oxo-4-hydroxy-4-carboxy-5-ureidoimidazoline decarboxylase n=1 Tax=Aquabacterium sp. TaxID=1872578 RepID=UPI0012226C73|nr:2-oxo-4-hydroxy-4-carboxy-5-ureidoimidazoline decarboxylase [Aquabacterium sp.]TAK87444.1 MAG: 2-oxo-4-hydroxy-4-carboxy-5-ureidoimidazoline decarboxylase [Aquabacterium sp.]